jgi:sugar phosphate isomerase/epimerase
MSTLTCLGRRLDRAALDAMASSGIRRIELFMQRPHFDPADSEDVERIAAALEGAGVEALSAHAPIYREHLKDRAARKQLTLSLCSQDTARREFAVRELLCAVEACGRLGIPNLVVHTGLTGHPAGDQALEIETCVESLHGAAQRAAYLGVSLSLENGTEPGVSVRLLLEVLARLDMPSAGLCLDTGHANLFGNLRADIREARQYLHSVHLHDNDGSEDQHLMPGRGNVNFMELLAFLRSSKFIGIMTMEIGADKDADSDGPGSLESLSRRAASIAASIADFESPLPSING